MTNVAEFQRFVLSKFTPYRIVALGDKFAHALSDEYARDGITIAEWRVLAVVGGGGQGQPPCGGIAARDVVSQTPMDKMAVSRAIATLEAKTLIERSADPKDRRISRITLTGEGRNIFEKVVAIALRFEERLLAGLSEHERRLFLELFDRVEAQAAREFQR